MSGLSVLEYAIQTAGLNSAVPEFGSQFVTQADLVTPIAPYLVVRGDTFRIRCYGEVTNPSNAEPLARVWGEAVVQRFPSPEASGASVAVETLAEQISPSSVFGRQFKILSFRWLPSSEL
jgi:hypothetical protein